MCISLRPSHITRALYRGDGVIMTDDNPANPFLKKSFEKEKELVALDRKSLQPCWERAGMSRSAKTISGMRTKYAAALSMQRCKCRNCDGQRQFLKRSLVRKGGRVLGMSSHAMSVSTFKDRNKCEFVANEFSCMVQMKIWANKKGWDDSLQPRHLPRTLCHSWLVNRNFVSGPESAHWGVGTPHTPSKNTPHTRLAPPCPLPIIHSNIIPDRGCPGLIYQPIHSTDDKLVNPKSSRFRHHSSPGRDWVSRISIKSQQIIVGHSECQAAGKLDKNLSNHLRDLVHFHARRFKSARSAHEARLFQRLSGIWVGFDWMAGRF